MNKFTFCGAATLAVAFLTFSAHGQRAVSPAATAAGSTPTPTQTAQRLNAPVPPEAVAAYFDDSHKDLKQVLAWMQETNTMNPQDWSVYAEARIRLKMKDMQGARVAAEQAKKLALAATPPHDDFARLSEEVLLQTNSVELASNVR